MTTKTKAHIIYKTKDGRRVAGVTTITEQLIEYQEKRNIIKWANNLGLEGEDSDAYRDEMGEIGKLAHYLIVCDYKGIKPDLSDNTQKQIDKAENCLIKFWMWRRGHTVEPLHLEMPQVSEVYRYGGTLDFLGNIDGILTIKDIKTSAQLYPKNFFQIAGYDGLVKENLNLVPEQYLLLRLGRDESEGFEVRVTTNIEPYWRIFLALLEVYNLKKQITKEK